jgi:hypothetical protein
LKYIVELAERATAKTFAEAGGAPGCGHHLASFT